MANFSEFVIKLIIESSGSQDAFDKVVAGLKNVETVITRTILPRTERAKKDFAEIETTLRSISSIAGTVGDKLSEGGRNFLHWISSALQIMAQAAQLFSKSQEEGGLRVGDIFGFLASIFPFFLAEGGPAKKGGPYIVGERGPELFVPDSSGTVIPNHILRWLKEGTNWLVPNRLTGGAVLAGAGGLNIYLNGKLLDGATKRQITKEGLYLENLSSGRNKNS